MQLPYKRMEFISRVSAHMGQNGELCLSAHGRLPGTLRYNIISRLAQSEGNLLLHIVQFCQLFGVLSALTKNSFTQIQLAWNLRVLCKSWRAKTRKTGRGEIPRNIGGGKSLNYSKTHYYLRAATLHHIIC